MPTISVALVEDDASTRERLVRAVLAERTLQLEFAATSVRQLLAWLDTGARPDVLLVDLGLPDGSGIEIISRCVRTLPDCAVLVLTLFGDDTSMLRAFEAGAQGYLLKDGTEDDLAVHIRSVHAGGSPMSPMIARRLLVRWQQRGGAPQSPATPAPTPTPAVGTELPSLGTTLPPAPAMVAAVAHAAVPLPVPQPVPLSPRESTVLDLISRGFTYAEIGQQLQVSVSTVQTHVRNVYGKLGVHSKTEAVFEARQIGLLR